MERKDILKDFTKKLIDYVFYSKKSTLKHSEWANSQFQLKTPMFSHVHNEVDYIWDDRGSVSKEFSVEIFQQLDNCVPLLLERWNFKLIPSSAQHPLPDYCSLSLVMRSLIGICEVLPSSSIFPKALYIKDSHLNTQWPASLGSSELYQFPTRPYQLQSASECLIIDVQYYQKPIKPSLCIQNLGERPRILSMGSLDTSPGLHERKTSFVETRNRGVSTVINESMCEENEVGIKLISSEYYEGSDFGEDFGRSSFDMEIEISEALDNPEEVKISLFLLGCEKVREMEIFKIPGEVNVEVLVSSWKRNQGLV